MTGLIDSMAGMQRAGILVIILLIAAVLMPYPCLAVSGKYRSIVERDPFDPKRGQDKTAIQGGTVSSDVGELEKRYSVYGIILAGANKSAFIKPVKAENRGRVKELRKVTVGDLVDGWTVKDITDRGLVLANGGDQVVLRVFAPKKERESNRPVGIATPRIVPVKPAINPMDQKRLKAALERSRPPKIKPGLISPSPGKENGQNIINPFLKAIQRQKERQKAGARPGRP